MCRALPLVWPFVLQVAGGSCSHADPTWTALPAELRGSCKLHEMQSARWSRWQIAATDGKGPQPQAPQTEGGICHGG